MPLTATNWEVEVEFKIHGSGHLHGDGFALWVTKDRATTGPVFGSKDRFEGLGVFFDTYKNNRPGITFPYVMAMIGDGQTSYDQANDGKANEIGGCSVWPPRLIHTRWTNSDPGSRTACGSGADEGESDVLSRQILGSKAAVQVGG